MRFTLGLVLFLIGGTIMLGGFGMAAKQMVDMYGAALSDPMKDSPATDGKAVKSAMLFWAGCGAVGIVPFAIGSAFMKTAARKALRARQR